MTTVKITKREKLDTLIAVLEGTQTLEDVDTDMLIEFCEHEKDLLDKKAASAKKAAAKKKEEGDELCDAVLAVLTNEFESIPDIAEKVEFEGSTLGKVQNRLNKLAKMGKAVKAQASVDGGEGVKARKIVVYRIANENDTVEAED